MPGPKDRKVKTLIDLANKLFRYNGRGEDEVMGLLGLGGKEFYDAISTLTLCGLPPYGPGDLFDVTIDDGRVWISHPYGLFDRPVRLSRTEALSLMLAGRASRGTLEPELESALDKIRGAMRPESLEEADKLTEQMDFSPETGAIRPLLEKLQKACGRRKVEIEYFTAGRGAMTARKVRPYGLIYNVDHWYLVGWCEMRGGLRVFRADRVKTARVTREAFEMPAGFDLDEFRRDKLMKYIERPHRVVIAFEKGLAAWAAERWPDRAKRRGDCVEVEFKVDRLESFVPTVLGYGVDAVVIEPPELRGLVAAAAEKTLKIYS